MPVDFPLWLVLVIAIIFIPPVLLFRPLIVAISNRIAGKSVNSEEVKLLKKKVLLLEDQLMEMKGRMIAIEDTHDFSKKMIEDVAKRRPDKS